MKNGMTQKMAVINLQLAGLLDFDKSSKGYIKYNKYMSTAHVASQDITESLELLTGSKEGEKWVIVGCKTGKCKKTGGYTGYGLKVIKSQFS